ncbi:MAG TPA: hypothetical protein VFF04_01485 [Candidatus Babeliales bacterium]|nr:hypothetical protein [Candidatus Babeliales bacterium]
MKKIRVPILSLVICCSSLIYTQPNNQFQGVNQAGVFITVTILQYPSDIKVDEQSIEEGATGLFTVPKIPGEYKMVIHFPNNTLVERVINVQHTGDIVGIYGDQTYQTEGEYTEDPTAHFNVTSPSYPIVSDTPPVSYSAEPVTNPWAPGYDDTSTNPSYE